MEKILVKKLLRSNVGGTNVETINYTMNIQEYRNKLLILSEQAEKDDRKFLCDFLNNLLLSQPENIALFDYIYKSADDVTSEMADCYMILLNNNAELVWYELISFVNEEKDNTKEFFDGLLDCFKHKVNPDLVKIWITESISVKEFLKQFSLWCDKNNEQNPEVVHIENKEPESESKMFIAHLKDENNALNVRLAEKERELSAVRQEVRETLNEAFSNRKAALENSLELEQLRKTVKSTNVALKLTESKLEKYKSMCNSMEITIKQLRENKPIVRDCSKEIAELNMQIQNLISSIEEKDNVIEKLNQELTDCRMQIEQLQSEDNFPESGFDEGMLLQSDINAPENIPESDFFDNDQGFLNVEIPDFVTKEDNNVQEDTAEELGYNPEELIEIKDGREEIVRHSNLFTKIFTKHQQKKFEKKTVSEQESLIFVKMMENNFSKDMVQTVKNAMKSNAYLSRFEIYDLISNKATEEEISSYCGGVAV